MGKLDARKLKPFASFPPFPGRHPSDSYGASAEAARDSAVEAEEAGNNLTLTTGSVTAAYEASDAVRPGGEAEAVFAQGSQAAAARPSTDGWPSDYSPMSSIGSLLRLPMPPAMM